MIRPRCPAPVVAAAMLLLVVGGEFVLAVVAFAGYLIAEGGIGEGGCCFPIIFGLGIVAAGNFLLTGVDLLRGTPKAFHGYGVITIVGVAGALASLSSTFCCVWVGVQERFDPGRLLAKGWGGLAALFALWANTAAVVVAWLLLRKNADRYLRWREAIHRPSEEAGHEPE